MVKRLQVKLNDNWEYVFCRNERYPDPVVTQDRRKAIKGTEHSIEYFQSKFANHEFRIVP